MSRRIAIWIAGGYLALVVCTTVVYLVLVYSLGSEQYALLEGLYAWFAGLDLPWIDTYATVSQFIPHGGRIVDIVVLSLVAVVGGAINAFALYWATRGIGGLVTRSRIGRTRQKSYR